jgi:excinuclease ABC subunit A
MKKSLILLTKFAGSLLQTQSNLSKISMSAPNYKHQIYIKGANIHNLKNVELSIPKNKLVVFTGVSGSGKTSLCIDTLFAEGQRRYVESLSSYARQFLSRMTKPDVESIKGLCPAIAIDQQVSGKTTRATVGSLTEVYDYLRVLFSRIGHTYSPISGKLVAKDEVQDVVNYILNKKEGSKLIISYPYIIKDTWKNELNLLMQKGFTRVNIAGTLVKIESLLEEPRVKNASIEIVVDRLVVNNDESFQNRVSDSVQTCFYESGGDCIITDLETGSESFNNRFEADGMTFEEPTPQFLNFNSPTGACQTCEGFGTVIGIDEDLVIPNKNLSVYQEAIVCWKGDKMKEWLQELLYNADKFNFPIHRPIKDLTKEEYKLLWKGNKHFSGIDEFFKYVEKNTYKIQYRVMLSRYRGRTTCRACNGTRLREDADYVKIDGKSIMDILILPIDEVCDFFKNIQLNDYDKKVAERILFEVNIRLNMLNDVGLGYLTLSRLANSLSGGESQRIKLTRSLGSNLTASMYILDEPSIGLHPRDTGRLIKVLQNLRDLGNTVIVVEHDEDIILAADYLVDMGPQAGRFGGEVVFSGEANLIKKTDTLTAQYITERKKIELPTQRRKAINHIFLKGATQHNLKNVDIKIPLQCMTVVSGVSGSGKTTLIKQILYPALKKEVEGFSEKTGSHSSIEGDLKKISQVEMIDQNPLGRNSRSNPVTYVKAYDPIRDLYTRQKLSKLRGFKPKHFSFNVEGGRCETCKGEGEVVIEMQFLADVGLVCEDCKGKRFKEEVLEVKYKDKSIYETLEMGIDEAIEFFASEKDIVSKLLPLEEVGLGYVKLGQSSSTLSGGEAQRLKLASFLTKGQNSSPILFIFDEPTTGLHFDDVNKLMKAFNALIAIGHTVVIIEHHPDVIKCADWLIELGPDGGKNGGFLVFEGVPEDLLSVTNSPTLPFIKSKLKK